MTPEDYQKLCAAFDEAVALPPESREPWLASQFAAQPELAQQLREMLSADENSVLDVSPLHQHLAADDLTPATMPLDPEKTAISRNDSDPLHSLPGYQLLDELGRGGMGVVFKARQLSPERIVAVKMILSGQFASTQEIQRFRAEAEAAANLSHAGIVPIYEVGHFEGRHFFSMGYVEGRSLADIIREGGLSFEKIAELVLEIAQAMAHAHAVGIVHRDLKPSNILLDADNRPRVTDFGLAKRMDGNSDMTYSGQILGSPGYMAPEQASGRNDQVGQATDIYGLGAILYALLTGKPPFSAGNMIEAIDQICTVNPIPPRKLNWHVPRPLETICLKCMHKTPSARYRSMKDLADDLDAFLRHEPIKAKPLGMGERIVYWARRKPGLASQWACVILFFLYHAVSSYIIKEKISAEPWFRVSSVVIALAAGLGAWFFQRMYERPSTRKVAIYGWMTWNFLLLTGLLFLVQGAASPLSLVYLLLTAASATLYEKGLVGYTMSLAAIGYMTHVLVGATIRPSSGVDFYQATCMMLSILVLGMIQYFVVRRIRNTLESQ
ncbi:serine/threonine protein kinase [Bremerella cremea]|uniref:non-specific serine/threonine protein kinase n=1 Tax=Bremerella cremea TaxID=1031537 RepID=A0A368KXP7_9BACT|nr:serine/threonine-protein kinase [Bremerella cremea]RCS56175.1 serine/threonine protein kinase [Bremerella cremea]